MVLPAAPNTGYPPSLSFFPGYLTPARTFQVTVTLGSTVPTLPYSTSTYILPTFLGQDPTRSPTLDPGAHPFHLSLVGHSDPLPCVSRGFHRVCRLPSPRRRDNLLPRPAATHSAMSGTITPSLLNKTPSGLGLLSLGLRYPLSMCPIPGVHDTVHSDFAGLVGCP
ncbi:hypothetical protein B0T26DRAFT_271627 [Lasiosphaeria miniovina]|uniref:Uncharacterized protein n=1 Tax=Lasiosphaeria miniovina TaxID=1954250 RepID=A0AA40AJE5_9PEZI|nr:uncharacterized protein B0T26DRAFT_271627 [Lasiosphaeria miniovina]KAK0716953.1 hypothetical protein B0T26DRAFT_271627 [Lasiosphaeria miniovina]